MSECYVCGSTGALLSTSFGPCCPLHSISTPAGRTPLDDSQMSTSSHCNSQQHTATYTFSCDEPTILPVSVTGGLEDSQTDSQTGSQTDSQTSIDHDPNNSLTSVQNIFAQAYTELSTSMMKLAAEASLAGSGTKTNPTSMLGKRASMNLNSKLPPSNDLLGDALFSVGSALKKKKKKPRTAPSPPNPPSSIPSDKPKPPNPYKRRSTKPVHMWTVGEGRNQVKGNGDNHGNNGSKRDKTWAEIESEVANDFGSHTCPNCNSTSCTPIAGGVGTGHRSKGMSTNKAETWGRKDDGGVLVVMMCGKCGLRFEEDAG
mmetsp:Transcript_12953/g.26471  ORF Transcript_12953/g.26471 Transcript_12953/m.26471 type:complete len:315 (+) Transcript_12953:46-990(+)